jgi:hypothetical protein
MALAGTWCGMILFRRLATVQGDLLSCAEKKAKNLRCAGDM